MTSYTGYSSLTTDKMLPLVTNVSLSNNAVTSWTATIDSYDSSSGIATVTVILSTGSYTGRSVSVTPAIDYVY